MCINLIFTNTQKTNVHENTKRKHSRTNMSLRIHECSFFVYSWTNKEKTFRNNHDSENSWLFIFCLFMNKHRTNIHESEQKRGTITAPWTSKRTYNKCLQNIWVFSGGNRNKTKLWFVWNGFTHQTKLRRTSHGC